MSEAPSRPLEGYPEIPPEEMRARARAFCERLSELSGVSDGDDQAIVDLIVIFVLQTIIFPLVFLWLFVEILNSAIEAVVDRAGGTGRQLPAIYPGAAGNRPG